MRKTLVSGVLLVAALLLVTGCTVNNYTSDSLADGGSTATDQQVQGGPTSQEIQDYKSQVIPLGIVESDLLDRYGSVTGDNYIDDATTYDELVTLLPDVQSFIGDLEAINPANPQLHAIHQEFVDGWNLQAKGMTLVTAALEEQDTSKIAEGNDALAKGRAALRQFQLDFAALGD